jgi:hypothetical protein
MVQAAELRVLGTLQSERLIVVTRQQQSSDKSTRGKRGGERQRGRESVRENETLTRRMNEVRSPSSREKRLEESAVEFHVLGLGLLDLLDLLRPKPSFRTPVARHSTTQVPSMHLHEPATTIPPRTSTFFHISTTRASSRSTGQLWDKRKTEHLPLLVLGPSHARILPICYKPSISDHPSGLHEQRTRTRLISPETHENIPLSC